MTSLTIEYDKLASKAYPYRAIQAYYMIFVSSLTLIVIISLLISIYKYKTKNRNIDLNLCIILLFLDLMCSSITLSTSLFSVFHYSKYISTQGLCNLNGILNFVPFSTAIELMGIISLERCLLVIYKKHYPYKKYIYLLLVFIMLNGVVNSVQTALANGFDILPNAIYCLFDPSTTGGLIGSIISGLCCIVAYTLIIICYMAICIYRRNETRKIRSNLGLNPIVIKREINSTIAKSVAIMLASLFTSGVYVSIMIISWFNPNIFTNITDMVQVIFIEPQMLINTILLLNMKPELLKNLKKLYGFNSEQNN
jgi:hypothetical protein